MRIRSRSLTGKTLSHNLSGAHGHMAHVANRVVAADPDRVRVFNSETVLRDMPRYRNNKQLAVRQRITGSASSFVSY
jgi:hypothetical protein